MHSTTASADTAVPSMQPAPIAVFLTEAGGVVGLGHLTRCVALYDALEALGYSCEILVAGEAPRHVIGARDVTPFEWRSPEAARDVSAGATIAAIDSYVADPETYDAVAETAALAVYLDDTARLPYPPGIVVNGNPEAAQMEFRCNPETTLLLGVEHQLLRREFTGVAPRKTHNRIARILVIPGGSNAGNVRDALVSIASSVCPDAAIDVVSEPRTAAELRDSMLAADIVLTAAGQTIYELAVTGTPTVATCVADNQIAQAHAFERAGALALAGEWGDTNIASQAENLLRSLMARESRELMSNSGRALVDGGGARRVATEAAREVILHELHMIPATPDDEDDMLVLANDPTVRSASFNSDIITPEVHHRWYVERMKNPDNLMLLARVDDRLLGLVRFAIQRQRAEISIAISPEFRGLRLALPMLQLGIEELARQRPDVAHAVAMVKPENLASQSLFESAGFHRTGATSESRLSYCYSKNLR